jgi:DNA polymerase III delta subunit
MLFVMAKRAASKPNPITAETRILLLTGKDTYLQAAYLDQLKALISEQDAPSDVIKFDGERTSPADVFDECRSMGLMAQHKIVVVNNADQFVKAENRARVEKYAQSPSESACLVLRSSTWHKGKLDKMIDAVGTHLKCDAPDEYQAIRWAIARCEKAHEATLDPRAAELLVERLGPDLSRIDSELAKLAAACEQGAPVDRALVEQFVGVSREQNVYDIQLLAMTAPPEKTLAKLRDILANDAPIRVRFAMTDLAKKLHAAARWLEGSRTGPRPNLWPREVADAVMHAASNAPPKAFADLLAHAVEADQRAKSSQGDESRTLEILVLRFAAICRR